MLKKLVIILALALTGLSACKNSGPAPAPQNTDIPELMTSVPSDALVVISSSRAGNALALLDSANILRRLELGRLERSRAALSLCYSGSLVPVLAIEASTPAEGDSTSDVTRILRQASELRLHAVHNRDGKRGTLIITPSEAQLTAVRRHLEEGTSILVADGFIKALSSRSSNQDFIILRNSGAARFLPKDLLGNIFTFKEMTAFARSLAEWTVMSQSGKGAYDISLVQNGTGEFFANLMDQVPAGGSDLSGLIPQNATFVLTMAVSLPEFRDALRRYRDASVKLDEYEKRLSGLRKSTGKDPLAWEKELGVREVALLCMPEGKLIMVRPAKAPAAHGMEPNPYTGFAAALYGNAFAIDDDSQMIADGGWNIYGSPAALEAFLGSDRLGEEIRWPKGYRLVTYSPEGTSAWGKKGINLWNTNL